MEKDDKSILKKYSSQEIADCIALLEDLVENNKLLVELPEEQRISLMKVAGKISRPNREEIRKRNRLIRKSRRKELSLKDRKARAKTGIRSARDASVFTAPTQILIEEKQKIQEQDLKFSRTCYVCNKEYHRLHFFYDAMCPSCGDFNYQKRFQKASLKGQVALITGARLKIGYHAAIRMLQAGAIVIVTTRFPIDAATRFSKETDFREWGERLHIYGLDLRHTPSVEIFCSYVEQKYERLDLLLNNAAQTVRRPPGFYAHLLQNEKRAFNNLNSAEQTLLENYEACKKQLHALGYTDSNKESNLPVVWHGKCPGIGLVASAELSQIPYSYDDSISSEEIFPQGKLDADLQQVDLRETNSWRLKIGEISTPEMLEVQLVNSIAPFVLCNRLIPMMQRDYTGQKHVVNVTAMEGKFLRFKKSERHPHTNMAKAAINMLTHTSSAALALDGIFMNAVDTGWVTDEDPVKLAERKQKVHDFQPPLDIVDGAARICDPFFDGILTGKHWCGKFLKDYFPIDW